MKPSIESLIMIEHLAPIRGVASLGKAYIATAGYDNKVILWDATNDNPLNQAMHDHLVNHCAFSPCGSYLITSSSDYTARVWEVPSLKLHAVLNQQKDDVMQANFSPDGEFIALCCYDGSIFLYGKNYKLKKIFKEHSGLIESFCWGGDSKSIYSSGTDNLIVKLDIKTLTCDKKISSEGVDIDTIICIKDEIAIGNDKGEIIFYDDDLVLKTKMDAHSSGLKRLYYDENNNLLVSIGYDSMLKVWKKNKKIELVHKEIIPGIVWPTSVSINSESQYIYISSFGSTYAIFSYSEKKWILDKIKPSRSINSIFYKKSEGLYSTGDSGTIFLNGHPISNVGTLCNFITSFDSLILVGGQSGKLHQVVKNGSEEIYNYKSPLNCIIASHINDIPTFFIGSYDGSLIILQFYENSFKEFNNIKISASAIKSLDISHNNVYIGTASGELFILDINTQVVSPFAKKLHSSILNDICAANNSVIFSVSRDLFLCIYKNTHTYKIKSQQGHSLKCVACKPDGSIIIFGSYRGTVELYDVIKNCWVSRPLKITYAGISSVCWKEVGSVFLASSYDGNIYEITPDGSNFKKWKIK